MPASMLRATIAVAVDWSTWEPKVMVPRTRRELSNPVSANERTSMRVLQAMCRGLQCWRRQRRRGQWRPGQILKQPNHRENPGLHTSPGRFSPYQPGTAVPCGASEGAAAHRRVHVQNGVPMADGDLEQQVFTDDAGLMGLRTGRASSRSGEAVVRLDSYPVWGSAPPMLPFVAALRLSPLLNSRNEPRCRSRPLTRAGTPWTVTHDGKSSRLQ